MSQNKRYLFVVNSGDDTVTSFRVGSGGRLTFADREPSHGDLPISLAINEDGDVLYVLNELSGNVHGFHVSHNGGLTSISGSTEPTNPTGPAVSLRISGSRRTTMS